MTTDELSKKELKKLKRKQEEATVDVSALKKLKRKQEAASDEFALKKPKRKQEEAMGESALGNRKKAAAGLEKHIEPAEETVNVSGADIKPAMDFASPKFASKLQHLFKGFTKPTPIQSYCWPAIQTGRDVIGIAETGSGKTLAFSLPALSTILAGEQQKKIKMVVVAPTRELALQTHNVLAETVGSVCIYGGMSKDDQRKELKTIRPVIVVGTPGRIVDFLEDGTLQFGSVTHFVLDEADRMLDMGFAEDINKIVGKLPEVHQTIMFSATWPMMIQTMAAKYLRKNPVKIVIGDRESGENKACARVSQLVECIRNPMERDSRLLQLLKQYHANRTNRVIVFVLYKKEAARLEHVLNRNGWKAASIHGDKPQSERTACMDRFRDGTSPLLVATDVAARGLDIPNVEYVINFTFPLTIEDYIHRIGRTGRGGKAGVAHTLFTDADKAHAGELVNVLKTSGVEVPEGLYNYDCTTKKKVHKLYGAFYKETDPTAEVSHITFSDDE